jgi:hypothetical protein
VSAALAHQPATLDDLLRQLGDTCVVCGEQTVGGLEGETRVATCQSCGSVLDEAHRDTRRTLRLVS